MRDVAYFKERGLNDFQAKAALYRNLNLLAAFAWPEAHLPLWKRFLDISCIVITSMLWGPVFLLIAMYIKLVSPGPVFFKQTRIGYMGRPFSCLKFRTMVPNADTGAHQRHLNQLIASNQPMRKLDNIGDDRLIPGGMWLRATGADELPQLINILRGEMSLVGPRPCVPYEYELFEPRHRLRCHTPPGLTGMWQVNGKNRTTFERMMELDLAYLEGRSLMLDLRIILFTPYAVLTQLADARRARRSRKISNVLACNMRAGQ